MSETFQAEPPSDATELMLGRRAARSGFTDYEVPRQVTESIVQCGLSAPSSKNAQPWRLHVVESRDALRQIAREVLLSKTSQKFVPHDPVTGQPRPEYQDTVEESAHTLGNVPLGIFIENSGDFSIDRQTVASSTKNRHGSIFGLALEYIGHGACIQNMWLAAEAHGLRAVFMGDVAIAENAIRIRLNMTGDLVGALAIGKSFSKPSPKRLKEDRVVWH